MQIEKYKKTKQQISINKAKTKVLPW